LRILDLKGKKSKSSNVVYTKLVNAYRNFSNIKFDQSLRLFIYNDNTNTLHIYALADGIILGEIHPRFIDSLLQKNDKRNGYVLLDEISCWVSQIPESNSNDNVIIGLWFGDSSKADAFVRQGIGFEIPESFPDSKIDSDDDSYWDSMWNQDFTEDSDETPWE